MIMTIYKRALAVLMKKPIRLWGISLLATVLIPVLVALCGVGIPVLGLAVSLLLSTSMLMVYLHGYRGEEVHVLHLFDCFRDWGTIKRVVLGLAWMMLWIFLWGLIPIAGPVFAAIRVYEYRLTPYILITEPEVPLTEAIKVSKERTNGYKWQMFGADILPYVIVWVASFLLGLLASIPVIGILFGLVLTVGSIAVGVLAPLFMGLVQAAFYEEITNPTLPAKANDAVCPNCGTPYPSEAALFCANCGTPRN